MRMKRLFLWHDKRESRPLYVKWREHPVQPKQPSGFILYTMIDVQELKPLQRRLRHRDE